MFSIGKYALQKKTSASLAGKVARMASCTPRIHGGSARRTFTSSRISCSSTASTSSQARLCRCTSRANSPSLLSARARCSATAASSVEQRSTELWRRAFGRLLRRQRGATHPSELVLAQPPARSPLSSARCDSGGDDNFGRRVLTCGENGLDGEIPCRFADQMPPRPVSASQLPVRFSVHLQLQEPTRNQGEATTPKKEARLL